MKKIETSAAPAAIGPYSQGIKIGNVVYCSGQIPVDPATGTVAGTAIAEQAEQSCKMLEQFWQQAAHLMSRW